MLTQSKETHKQRPRPDSSAQPLRFTFPLFLLHCLCCSLSLTHPSMLHAGVRCSWLGLLTVHTASEREPPPQPGPQDTCLRGTKIKSRHVVTWAKDVGYRLLVPYCKSSLISRESGGCVPVKDLKSSAASVSSLQSELMIWEFGIATK